LFFCYYKVYFSNLAKIDYFYMYFFS